MATFDNLQESSFREVPFLMPVESLNKGIKTAVHEYLNSDERYIEEFGKIPPTINMQCIIHGDNSVNDRIRFEQALDQGGFGELIHPIYGVLQVKVIGEYTVSSTQRRIGEHVFDVTFGLSRDNISPEVSFVSKNEISNQALNNLNSLSDDIESKYTVLSTGFNIKKVANKFSQILSEFTEAVDAAEENLIPGNVVDFLNDIERIQSNIYYIASVPTEIVNNFNSIFLKFRKLASTPSDMLTGFQRLISTVRGDLPSNTFLRRQFRNNSLLLDEYKNLGALNFLFESAVYKEYKTDIELISTETLISDIFHTFFDQQINNNDNVPTMLSTIHIRDVFFKLNALFSQAFILKEQNVWKVKEIEDSSTTSLISHKYFGDLDTLNIINELNPGINHSGFDGKILMVSK